ncbi:helix-turn-helix domain-containing protein [Spongiivirga citrea]|uniref:Helix-turn-helix domain-containing protein n=1 Tax=Spongiivirga citrea TaxID=1481457 RepID=A0A6M0CZA9_9FLAO|nr:AraC family transcriptional regulator [Spongiivirga citrea]NER19130.1 helix-turn-helix domain-containing protein [Spongiivirga citrea]
MNRINLYESFVLHQYQFDVWQMEPHNHNFFEIIFIDEGSGYHTINDIRFKYKGKDIFLIAPEDVHHFEIEERTKFTYFKFTETLFTHNKQLPERSQWLRRIEHILHNPNLMPGDIINNETDRELLWQIHGLVVNEYVNDEPYSKHIISNTVSTILSIIARNIERNYKKSNPKYAKKRSRIEEVLGYIRTNVYEHDLMNTSDIASNFGMSPNSINALFKRETGDSIRRYIENYKMLLVQYRLRNTDQTIAEIAYELGFTDESHLTKVFKKHYQITPKVFKQANNAPA